MFLFFYGLERFAFVDAAEDPSLRELGHTPFAVVDVETTGMAPHRSDRIVEIAVVRVSPSGTVEKSWTTVVDPECDPGPTHIHGLSSGQLAGAPHFADIADELAAQLEGTVVVAHNARFDMSFLEAEFLRAGREPPRWPLLCTVEMADFLGSGGARRLQDCCAAEGIIVDRTHEALADATATATLLTQLSGANWITCLQSSATATTAPAPETGLDRPHDWPGGRGPPPERCIRRFPLRAARAR